MLNGLPCPVCHGWDNYGNSTTSNIRVSIAMLANPGSVIHLPPNNPKAQNFFPFPDDFYLSAPMFLRQTDNIGYPNAPPGAAQLPLIATEDFFKWGVNVGVWKHAYNGGAPNSMNPNDTPMLFPSTIEPAWGTVAIASARVGLRVGPSDPAPADPSPYIQNGYRYGFTPDGLIAGDRGTWCSSLANLYYADVQANLFASKLQVADYDLDEDILQFAPATAIDESGLSYLWSSILVQDQNSYIHRNDWMDRFNGQSDPRVGAALRNMQNPYNPQGPPFDYGSGGLNQVVQH